MILFAAYLAGIRVYEDADERVKQGALTPIVVDFMYKRRVAEVLLDFGLVTFCYYAAYRIRFEDAADFTANFDSFSRSLPLVLGAQIVAFFAVGIYRGMWRHFGMRDSLAVARGVFFGTVTAQVIILYVYRFRAYSRTVFVIYGVLLLMAVVLTRASVRMVSEFVQRQRQSGRRVVIYGAGDAGPARHPGAARRRRWRHEDPRVRGRRSAQGGHPHPGLPGARGLFRAGRSRQGVVGGQRRDQRAPHAARAPQQPRAAVQRVPHPPLASSDRHRGDCRGGRGPRRGQSGASARDPAPVQVLGPHTFKATTTQSTMPELPASGAATPYIDRRLSSSNTRRSSRR